MREKKGETTSVEDVGMTDSSKVVSLMHQLHFTATKIPGTHCY
jgi:hypothetical protein